MLSDPASTRGTTLSLEVPKFMTQKQSDFVPDGLL